MKQDMYYSPKDAVNELQRRQSLGIREDVEKWWKSKGWPMPHLPSGELGILARQIATARYEDLVFAEMSKSVGLQALWIEYSKDKFVSHSKFKRSLLQPFFCSGKGKGNGWKTQKEKLACVIDCDGELLDNIQVGENSLVEYHHSLQEKFIPGALRLEMSDTYAAFDGAKNYYPALLSLFVAHGVLFEDYHGGESGKALDGFTEKIFQPAWKMIVSELGLKPLIAPLPWWDGMQFYPANNSWLEHGVFDEQSIAKLIV